MTSSELQDLRKDVRAILRGDLKLNSPDLPLASAERWKELGLSGERVYASFSPLSSNSSRREKPHTR